MANNRVIGLNNSMPWHLPADLKHFKALTLGKPVIMGRKTYESIGKALPGRKNIVVSTNASYALVDATVVSNCNDALDEALLESKDIMIIGGGAIYEAFLPLANQLCLTFIDANIEGDTHFPDYASCGTWLETSREEKLADDKNKFDYAFVTLQKQT